MKRILVAGVIVLAVSSVFVVLHFVVRNRQAGNVRNDALWLMNSLRTGNQRAVATYLAHPKMSAADMEKGMLAYAQALIATDFENAPLTFRTEGAALFASFQCSEDVILTFYTEDGGDIWRVAEIQSR